MDRSPRPLSRQQAFNTNRVAKKLTRLATKAAFDFGMIGANDKVMVCLSGGKDSYTLLDVLLTMREHAPFRFEIVAVNLDQKQPGFPESFHDPSFLSCFLAMPRILGHGSRPHERLEARQSPAQRPRILQAR